MQSYNLTKFAWIHLQSKCALEVKIGSHLVECLITIYYIIFLKKKLSVDLSNI